MMIFDDKEKHSVLISDTGSFLYGLKTQYYNLTYYRKTTSVYSCVKWYYIERNELCQYNVLGSTKN